MLFNSANYIIDENGNALNISEALHIHKTPKVFYKYFNFNDNVKENKKRMKQLVSEKLWLSRKNNLNDPMDLMMLNTNKLSCEEKDYYYESINNKYCLCLTSTYRNPPMWAHYANSFSGYCIGFKPIYGANIKPINYVTNLLELTEEYKLFFSLLQSGDLISASQLNSIFEKPKQTLDLMRLCNTMFYSKTKDWAYEKEYRIIEPCHVEDDEAGRLFLVSELGLRVSEIILGLKCSEENKAVMQDVCKKVNQKRGKREYIKLYQLSLDGCKFIKKRVSGDSGKVN